MLAGWPKPNGRNRDIPSQFPCAFRTSDEFVDFVLTKSRIPSKESNP